MWPFQRKTRPKGCKYPAYGSVTQCPTCSAAGPFEAYTWWLKETDFGTWVCVKELHRVCPACGADWREKLPGLEAPRRKRIELPDCGAVAQCSACGSHGPFRPDMVRADVIYTDCGPWQPPPDFGRVCDKCGHWWREKTFAQTVATRIRTELEATPWPPKPQPTGNSASDSSSTPRGRTPPPAATTPDGSDCGDGI